MINLIHVIYVVKDLVRIVAFRHTLEYRYIQVIHLINVAYVVKDLVKILHYRYTLERILVINFINVMYRYVVTDLVRMVTDNVQTHIRMHTGDTYMYIYVINVIYVVKCLVEILIYKITLEYIRILVIIYI